MTTLSLPATERRPLIPILVALSVAHLLNDLLQSMIPALYPLIKETYRLDFMQVGLITLAFQVTSSLLQPLLGYLTDKRPWPYAMVAGMGATLVGLLTLAFAASYAMVLIAAALVGLGSAVFHPEATRMARHAAAGRQGLAQGLFQVGGHAGYAIGPLLAAAIVVPRGQASLAWFSIVVLIAMTLMSWTASRYSAFRRSQRKGHGEEIARHGLSRGRVLFAMAILVLLLVSKNGYNAAFTSYYTFYLITRFEITVQLSQIMLFAYLAVSTFGVIIGGMVGDRIGRDRVIWLSIVGSLPFALLLPHADLFWTGVLSVIIARTAPTRLGRYQRYLPSLLLLPVRLVRTYAFVRSFKFSKVSVLRLLNISESSTCKLLLAKQLQNSASGLRNHIENFCCTHRACQLSTI